MVQNRPILDIVSHLVLIFGILIVALPIWITFVAATHDPLRMTQAPILCYQAVIFGKIL